MKNRLMPFFKQEILVESEAKGGLDSKEYTDALAKTMGFRKTLLDIIAANKLDALSGFTNGPACCIDLVNGDYDNGPSLSTPAAITGFPHITVPMGLIPRTSAWDFFLCRSVYGSIIDFPCLFI